jgi:hypothetical protein
MDRSAYSLREGQGYVMMRPHFEARLKPDKTDRRPI